MVNAFRTGCGTHEQVATHLGPPLRTRDINSPWTVNAGLSQHQDSCPARRTASARRVSHDDRWTSTPAPPCACAERLPRGFLLTRLPPASDSMEMSSSGMPALVTKLTNGVVPPSLPSTAAAFAFPHPQSSSTEKDSTS
ncbi:hypothetical protein PsYK624_104520 [Phanerochaete sordida]|uniref:Uncharacterized protein n=1 Tax=Phanerochaete sordida TaxID=48140 RepID=A0A9P3GG35_9APHY|nr:hypothetical protein PsYK624_104520 [Phanerochaete sordida]